jgi:hypothetical protein
MKQIRNVIGVVLGNMSAGVVNMGTYTVIVGQVNSQITATRKKILEMVAIGRMAPARRDADGVLWADNENYLDPRLEAIVDMFHECATWMCSSERFQAGDSRNVPTVFAAFIGSEPVAFFAPVAPVGTSEEKRKQLAKTMN